MNQGMVFSGGAQHSFAVLGAGAELTLQPPKKVLASRHGISFVEGPMGLEPMTPCLKGRCSNRLSYGPKLVIYMDLGFSYWQ